MTARSHTRTARKARRRSRRQFLVRQERLRRRGQVRVQGRER